MNLTLKEKCHLVTGLGDWHTNDLNGKLPSLHLSDGPHGLRSQKEGAQNNDSQLSTCFPTASASACSWDPELISEMSSAIAEEAIAAGVSVLLGPGVNMKRNPLCGRNFEYFSEDPYLAGKLASSYVGAVQSHGVAVSLKHFAGNNQETLRFTSNSMIDERTLREIYLSAFEMVVRESSPATIMSSYNRLNGTHSSENRELLTDILRQQWGYQGLVVSDWGACTDLPACIDAGMDLEMPDSRGLHYDSLLNAVKNGQIPEESLDRAVQKILSLVSAYPAKNYDGAEVPSSLREKHHAIAEKVAENSAVLLKNDHFFPLHASGSLLIIGGLAANVRIQGGGSSHIHTDHIDSFFDAFTSCGFTPVVITGYRADTAISDPALEEEALLAVRQAKSQHTPILFFGGLTDIAESEGYDREDDSFPENQIQLLQKIMEITEDIGIVSFSGAPYDLSLMTRARAILQMYLCGEAAATACARLISGQANPCGKLAETWPLSFKDAPSYGNYARQEHQADHPDDVEYRESLYMGYRYYDSFHVPVRYPFGHGLSYSSFSYRDLSFDPDTMQVRVTVKNTGSCAGKETIQIYIRNPKTNLLRADRELRGFKKVFLKPGEESLLSIPISPRSFMIYADSTVLSAEKGFIPSPGLYEIQAGSSLDDIRLETAYTLPGEPLCSSVPEPEFIPMTHEQFLQFYTYPIRNFSRISTGEYSFRSTINQLSAACWQGKILRYFAIAVLRAKTRSLPHDDPVVQMMFDGMLDGCVDNVCRQSQGLLKPSLIQKVIRAANARPTKE